MGNVGRWDLARQTANVVGALFQIGVTLAASAAIREVTDEGSGSLVEPALYAFAIWALIFVLSLVYAAYQALPSNRENPLLRRIGWFTVGAFFCTGLWSVFVPERQFVLAQTMLVVIFACLAIAYLRLAHDLRGRASSMGERWLVALPLGPFFGWITAANAVSLTSEAGRFGLVNSGGTSEALLGATLLLLGGILAAAVVLISKAGPVQGYLTYAATVLWALVAVIVNQYDASVLTTGAALVAAVTVALALFGRFSHERPLRERGSSSRPNIAV